MTAEYDTLKEELSNVKSELAQTLDSKDSTIQLLTKKGKKQEETYKNEIAAKNEAISKVETEFAQIKTELEELQKLQAKEKEEVETALLEKDKEKQVRMFWSCVK